LGVGAHSAGFAFFRRLIAVWSVGVCRHGTFAEPLDAIAGALARLTDVTVVITRGAHPRAPVAIGAARCITVAKALGRRYRWRLREAVHGHFGDVVLGGITLIRKRRMQAAHDQKPQNPRKKHCEAVYYANVLRPYL